MIIVMIRAIILYAVIIFSLRMMGKRLIGELQPSELVVTILISNMAAVPIEDSNTPMLIGAIPILALVGFELLSSKIALKSASFRRIISGSPAVLIKDGVLDQKQMKKLRISVEDMLEAMRGAQISKLDDITYAIMETNGKISFFKKFEASPATAEMLSLKGADEPLPMPVVSDGKVNEETLKMFHLDIKWLEKILTKNKKKLKDVFLMTVDKNAEYFILPKE